MASEVTRASPPAGSPERNGSAAPSAQDAAANPIPNASPWLDRLWPVAAAFGAWLHRPRVRLTVAGVILLLVGGLFVTSSVWTLPLVIIGALMVVVAWVGGRLDGRFAVEWGETGTQLEFRAQIKAAASAPPALSRLSSSAHGPAHTPRLEHQDAEVLDGEAHTVEIEVAELKALIAAAQNSEPEIARRDGSAQAAPSLRVANGGGHSSEAAR